MIGLHRESRENTHMSQTLKYTKIRGHPVTGKMLGHLVSPKHWVLKKGHSVYLGHLSFFKKMSALAWRIKVTYVSFSIYSSCDFLILGV